MLHWLEQLAEEVVERLAIDQKQVSSAQHVVRPCPHSHQCGMSSLSPLLQYQRCAEVVTVHFHPEDSPSPLSRSIPIRSLDTGTIVKNAWTAMHRGFPPPKAVDPAGQTALGW